MGKIICPQCSQQIDDSVRACPHCGFDKISSDLLQLERQKQAKYIDYTSFHNDIPIQPTINNTTKCPTCGSLQVEKISTGKKVVGGALFGLFSSDVRNTMYCKSCGCKW